MCGGVPTINAKNFSSLAFLLGHKRSLCPFLVESFRVWDTSEACALYVCVNFADITNRLFIEGSFWTIIYGYRIKFEREDEIWEMDY